MPSFKTLKTTGKYHTATLDLSQVVLYVEGDGFVTVYFLGGLTIEFTDTAATDFITAMNNYRGSIKR